MLWRAPLKQETLAGINGKLFSFLPDTRKSHSVYFYAINSHVINFATSARVLQYISKY